MQRKIIVKIKETCKKCGENRFIENKQIRFGTQSKLFRVLDKIIELVNEGILRRVSKTLE